MDVRITRVMKRSNVTKETILSSLRSTMGTERVFSRLAGNMWRAVVAGILRYLSFQCTVCLDSMGCSNCGQRWKGTSRLWHASELYPF